ncbi:hypothetical protein QE363_002380 [Sphingomonas sp. SORGH_AS870]|uniref:hypothetical protein n=1 Tax=Sphingomonas sp. SORGH_AS_0870 TaxID=3041801 RepID=UPI0028581D0B|nr:hypothetical protein [Sphingomonas sp. SORGH_AS_0870]MDR6146587.1 hypothetical protein [Sphingomonas sp. SORGH_AS_0870]
MARFIRDQPEKDEAEFAAIEHARATPAAGTLAPHEPVAAARPPEHAFPIGRPEMPPAARVAIAMLAPMMMVSHKSSLFR